MPIDSDYYDSRLKSMEKEYFTYDDICLVPQYSTVSSRNDVDLTSGKLKLKIPVIAANMDTVTESKMAVAMYQSGGLGILHRFMSFDKLRQEVEIFYKNVPNAYENLALSVGTNDASYEILDYVLEKSKIVCIDIAHGHSEQVIRLIDKIKSKNTNSLVIAGNVATSEGVHDLAIAGADIVKVGVGGGSVCSTRVVTGHGVPQFSAVLECSQEAKKHNVEIIADGGIKTSGDLAKSFAAGADYAMLGSLFAATEESPGDLIIIDGQQYKCYRGMASLEAQVTIGKEQTKVVPEGVMHYKPYKGSVGMVLYQLAGGLRSALSYSGAHTIPEFKEKARYIRVTSASFIEGKPHGLLN